MQLSMKEYNAFERKQSEEKIHILAVHVVGFIFLFCCEIRILSPEWCSAFTPDA